MSDSNDEIGPSSSKQRRLSAYASSEHSDEIPIYNVYPDGTIVGNSNETNEPSENVKKISDLNEKCLMQICDFLNFTDLLNVANATQKMCKAAGEIYAKKYANKLVKYNGNAINTKGLEIDVTDDTIEINEARSCLKMLRAFGAIFTRLKLNFLGIGPRRSTAISRIMNECCANTLIDLDWHNCPKDSMKYATKKFQKLENLCVVSGNFGVEMCQITYFFPNLHRLEITDVEVADRNCIERTFHGLLHMKLSIESRKGVDFLKRNIKTAMNLNPQLTSFSIGYGCDVKLLEYMNDQLPKLKTLEIQKPRKKFYDDKEEKVHFKLVRNLRLDASDSKESFTNIPFTFRCLKRFQLNASFLHRNKWIDFAVQNQKLVELKLLNFHWFYVMEKENLMKIATLPRLSNLVLDWKVPSTKAIIQCMEECKNLTKLRLSLRTRPERAAICAEITDKWKMEIDNHFLTLDKIKDEQLEGEEVELEESSSYN